MLAAQINIGLRSIDEGREELNLQPWGLPETSEPIMVTPTGPVPLAQAVQQAAASASASVAGSNQAEQAFRSGAASPSQVVPSQQQQAQAQQAQAAHQISQQNVQMRQESHDVNMQSQGPPQPGQQPPGPPGQQQAGQKPVPGNAQIQASPSTASAQAGNQAQSAKPGGGTPSGNAAAKQPAQNKAVVNELQALARHLNKGRPIKTWVPVHIPGHVLSGIEEDLGKGITPAEAITTLLLTADTEKLTQPPVPVPVPERGGTVDRSPVPDGWPSWLAFLEPRAESRS